MHDINRHIFVNALIECVRGVTFLGTFNLFEYQAQSHTWLMGSSSKIVTVGSNYGLNI